MGIFYLLFVFLLLGSLINPRWQKPFILFSFAILFILAGFRGSSVGTDTATYEQFFHRLARGGTVVQEIGWQILNKIIIYFNGGFQEVLIASSLLTLIPIFFVVKKYSANPMLSIFLYYATYIYLQSFNITRQAIAVSIVLFAYIFLLNKKYWLYLALIVFAATFHTTALLCLPLVFIHKIPDNRNAYIGVMGLTLVIGWFLSEYIIRWSTNLLGYDHYLDLYESGGGVGIYLIVLNAFFVFVLFTAKNRDNLFKLFFVFILLANLTAQVPYGYRLVYYFTVIQVLYLPYFVYNNNLKARPIAFLIVVLYASLVFSRSAGLGGIIPYINTLF